MSKKKKQPGFLARVKTNGTTYIYLRQAKRTPNGIKNERIYSFGPAHKALETMLYFFNNPEEFPKPLTEAGYTLEDLDNWMWTLNTKTTPTGKPFDF
ncbi:hypothetical protein OQZ55_00235 [Bacillus subtilis]|uniref:hypothetical protein n=1 Tax=Bacillus subtilis TaxID=1423 RepID=UPI00225108E8|nr:hypothetical protein [Bacillus subtilis]MCX4074743.1 hypothetical protein [Bacillus subtilis]WBC28211.1 hypothetical protein O6U12_22320 [Bacillus subtilis]